MAITDIVVSGKLFQDDGDPVNGATVALLETGTSTSEATTTSDSNGVWTFTETSLDTTYDIKLTSGSSVRYILWSDEITAKGVDTASLKVRGTEGAVAPIYFFADQADDAGDAWRIQASASDTLAIGSDKASAGTIIDYLTITNGASAAASVVAVGGDLTVGDDLSLTSDSAVLNMGAGNDFTITHDGTTGATIAGNPLTLDSGADIVLDAEGADVILKDGGTQYGALTNSSSNLIVKSGSTTAATFSGANVTFAGTVDATTDFTIGSTVITDDSIVMTPSTSDTVTIAGATHGILNVTTVDAAGTAADVNIDADGEIVIDAADAAGAIFKIAGTAQLSVIDGAILPTTDNDIDLGSDSYQFKDAYVNGTLEADAVTIGGTNVVTGSLITTLGTISAGVWQGTAIASGYIAADAITGAKIADDAIDSEHYTDGSIDNAHIADDAINSEHYAAASIDFAHIQNVAANSILGRNANSSGVLSEVALATTQILIGDGTGFTPAALSGDATMTNAGVVSLATTQNSITTMTGLVTTGALDTGSITSGFGTIDTGSSAITTTGLISGGSLDIDNVLINGTTIGHTDDTDLLTLTDGVLTVAGEVDATTLDVSGNADIDGTANLDNTDIDGNLVVDGINISLDSTTSLNIDNSNTSNGITIGTATSGVPVSIGHTTSETTVRDNLSVSGDLDVNLDLTVQKSLFVNDTSNNYSTLGLTINQGAYDNNIITLQSSDVGHGMTWDHDADTYARFMKSEAGGGLRIESLKDGDGNNYGVLELAAFLDDTSANTAKTTSGRGMIVMQVGLRDGTGIGAMAADDNLLVILNYSTTRFIWDAEGSAHADVEWTTYDKHDDLSLVADMEQELLLHEDEAKTERRHMLEEIGIIGEDSWHMENGKPRAMINTTKLSMLHHGALIQAGERIKALESKLQAIEGGNHGNG
jgi:hypothetical protein